MSDRRPADRPAVAVRKRPASAGEKPADPKKAKSMGAVEKPADPKKAKSMALANLWYASDFSGLDGGAAAMHELGVPFRHWFGSEVDGPFRAVNEALHPDCEKLYKSVQDRTDALAALAAERRQHPERRLVYTAGFPCVSFSPCGKRLGDKCAEGILVYHSIAAIGHLLPDVYILENVPSLSTDAKYAATFEDILQKLRGLAKNAYEVQYTVLDSLTHGGVPQRRRRLYLVGVRKCKKQCAWSWPAPLPQVSLSTILDKRPPGAQLDVSKASQTVQRNLKQGLTWLKEHNVKDWRKVPWVINCHPSEGWSTKPTCDFLPTIIKGHARNLWVSSVQDFLAPVELLRAQGFSDSFTTGRPLFRNMLAQGKHDSSLCKMAGNAFTATVIEQLLRALLPAVGVKLPSK